jgi:ASC-1-like (ASCH) protein
MKKVIFAAFLLFILVACTAQEGTERGLFGQKQPTKETAYTGTKGVEISLEDPSMLKVTKGDSIFFDLRVENLGWFATTVYLYVSGFDPAFVTYKSFKNQLTLNGKTGVSDAVIPGDWEIVSFESNPVSSPGLQFPQNTVISACYLYQTQITYATCVDENADGKCTLAVTNNPLSSGQGAPVVIDSVTSTATRKASNMVRLTYTIALSQKDLDNIAQIIRKEKVQDACTGKPLDQYRDYGVLNIDDARLGSKSLTCLPKDTINLQSQKSVTCYMDTTSGPDLASAFVFKVSYGVTKQITKPVTITSTE